MKTSINSIDELGRREFIANAAKACLGVGLMPMAGSYIHNSVKPNSWCKTSNCPACHLSQHVRSYVSFGYIWSKAKQPRHPRTR